ncbi:phosphotransferase [Actinomadura sp. HBU206391]|uniref:phosphotransferase n=1 Tax=Actinomadura sp. HBU206391 TaxID=2731692 RepID=UPI00164FEFE4|nr:phosphotransferase [Actinomadura sp. HBU206391]MBC6462550.1 phosphotransferase [Actinomadura sp. HBU206391]
MSGDHGAAGAPEWASEQAVSATEAAELVGAHFADLRGAPVRLLDTGWDNTVYLVGAEWVFRFPRRAIALPGMDREIAVLPPLAPRVPLPIPVPELVGTPSHGYPWCFWGARLIPGRELAEARLPDADRVGAAGELGEFLRALHDPDLVPAVGAGLPDDPLRRADPGVRVPMARERLARLSEYGVWNPAVEALLAEAELLGPPTGPVSVCHGDLHVRHLLVDENARAAGVIDWGDVCVADPAIDLSLVYSGFEGPARAALLAAYGPVGLERETRARMLAVFLCAALAEYAASTDRAQLLAESLTGIRRAVAG